MCIRDRLQISLLDWQDQPDSDEYMNLQKMVQENNYEQSHNKEIEGWESELEAVSYTHLLLCSNSCSGKYLESGCDQTSW